jgi:hypothetical protein
MNDERDRRLDELLAQGRLSGPALERILDGALAASGVRRRKRWGWALALGAPTLAAAAVLLVARPAEFRAKGGAGQGAVVELVCGQETGADVHCHRADDLYFRVGDLPTRRFLSAYAAPLAGGERIWFFPTSATEPIALSPGAPQVAGRSIKLAGLPEGKYRVAITLSEAPLSQQAILAAPPSAEAQLEVFRE